MYLVSFLRPCDDEVLSVSSPSLQIKNMAKDVKADPNEDLDNTSAQVIDSESKNCPPIEVIEPKYQA
ncbi:hypothetical protein BC332_28931 [Capsicum chinense]|nr:hypothetical protein BC332_28931 [Capsicum chinense]